MGNTVLRRAVARSAHRSFLTELGAVRYAANLGDTKVSARTPPAKDGKAGDDAASRSVSFIGDDCIAEGWLCKGMIR